MPDIDIHHPHSLGRRQCREAAAAVADELSARFGLHDVHWDGDTLAFAGRGVAGTLAITDSDAHVNVRLGPLLGLMRPAIEAEIRRRLDEHLA